VILIDTNVLIYAFDPGSEFYAWSRETLTSALAKEGAAINPVILTELCVGDYEPETVENRLAQIGLHFLDLKPEISTTCARAFRRYLQHRKQADQRVENKIPLPDFFIGAHAAVLDLPLATVDVDRYRTYFPSVNLICP
jgi:predicted nucleic acid-binding protein